jgi:CHAD domain-containing protein
MRVAIRQMRSALRLLKPYYKSRWIKPFADDLRWILRGLGEVRDLDVMIRDLTAFEGSMDEEQKAALNDVIYSLDQRRSVARQNLNHILDSKAYRRFHKNYSDFLMTAGAGAKNLDEDEIQPIQLRHVLPPMIYEHLATVRAYDRVLTEPDVDAPTLHALRIDGKQLRYIVALFSEVLGKEIEGFVEDLKILQDHLGRLNDIEVATQSLLELMEDMEPDQNAAIRVYIDALERENPALLAEFPAKWRRFNSKTVQRKLANAVLAL